MYWALSGTERSVINRTDTNPTLIEIIQILNKQHKIITWNNTREIKKWRGKQREREREKKEKEKENNKDFCSQRLPRRVNNHKNNNYDV